jgi:succinoglycan biosynthesis protein ExoA
VPLRLLPNPAGHIPHALNLGIAAAAGEVILRLDGHARPAPDYVRQCLAVLAETGAAVVGGAWEIRPGGPGRLARAIALAVSSPLGAGDARYRLPRAKPGPVDTVPYGCYYRQTWASLKGYNQTLLTNEDYEFNLRARARGGQVYFDPRIRCEYFARATLEALARQYWRYGWWKAQMLKRHPRSLRWRQLLPLAWSLLGPLLLAVAGLNPLAAWVALLAWAAYWAVLLSSAATLARRADDFWLWPLVVASLIIIHFSWGLGAWVSLLSTRQKVT